MKAGTLAGVAVCAWVAVALLASPANAASPVNTVANSAGSSVQPVNTTVPGFAPVTGTVGIGELQTSAPIGSVGAPETAAPGVVAPAPNTAVSGGSSTGTGTAPATSSGGNVVSSPPLISAPAGTVNGVQYKLTPGGTYVPGFGPSGGIVTVPQAQGGPVYAGSDDSAAQPPASTPQAAQPPQPDYPITQSEAVEGLTDANPGQITSDIRRWSLVDSAKVMSRNDRIILREKVLDSPVATGNEDLLSQALRTAGLIQRFHVVCGVIPRKNMLLIGLRSSEED